MPQRTKSADDVFGFGREDEFLQPVLQPQVVGDAAEQRHGGVRVGVDQARARGSRRAGRAAAWAGSVRSISALRADRHDALAADGHGAVFDHAALRRPSVMT